MAITPEILKEPLKGYEKPEDLMGRQTDGNGPQRSEDRFPEATVGRRFRVGTPVGRRESKEHG